MLVPKGRVVLGLGALLGLAIAGWTAGCEGVGDLVQNPFLDYSERVSGVLVENGTVTVYGSGNSRNEASGYQFYRRICFTKDGAPLFSIDAHPISAKDGYWRHECGAGGPGRPPGRYQVLVTKWAERPGIRYQDQTPSDNSGVASIQVDGGAAGPMANGVDYVVQPVNIMPKAGGQFEFNATIINNGDAPPRTSTRAKVNFVAETGLTQDDFARRFRPKTEFDLRLLSPGDEETFSGTLDLNGLASMPPRIQGKVTVTIDDVNQGNNSRGWGLELSSANGVSPTLTVEKPTVVVNKQPAYVERSFVAGSLIVDGVEIRNAGGPALSIHYTIAPVVRPGSIAPFQPIEGDIQNADGARSWILEPKSIPLTEMSCGPTGPTDLQVLVRAYARFDDGFGNGNIVQSPTTDSPPSDPDPIDPCVAPPEEDPSRRDP